MKPGLVSTYDLKGGASRSAYRLHQGLREINIDSHMFVQQKQSFDVSVHAPRPNLPRQLSHLKPWLSELPLRKYRKRPQTPFSTNQIPDFLDGITDRIHQASIDIVNLHWVSDGFFPLDVLSQLKVPIVWTLHDMWAMTGGCHYNGECDRYQQKCQSCPQLNSQKQQDLSYQEFQRKRNVYRKIDPVIVCPSQWLRQCAIESALLKDLRIEVIPYGIDTNIFRPIPKDIARSLLKLPLNEILILTGAINLKDSRKGFSLLKSTLNQLNENHKFHLLVFGEASDSSDNFDYPIHRLGNMNDDLMLVLAYSAADIFVAPSIQDNLPNTVLEAMSCGVPVVAFKIGGMPDLIESKTTGYLAEPFTIDSLAYGIQWALSNKEILSIASRKKVENNFTLAHQAKRYIQLFENLSSSR